MQLNANEGGGTKMTYVNFNETGVTGDNVEQFIDTVVDFARRKGLAAASAWLFKLNPLAGAHLSGEMDFTGGGYTRGRASRIVRGEYDHAPLPQKCECGGIAWYKATFSATRCMDCGDLMNSNEYLDLQLSEDDFSR